MSQLPDSIRIIFINPNSALLSKETLTHTRAFIENRGKFNQIVQISKKAITTSVLELEILRCRFKTLRTSVRAASTDFSKALEGTTLDFLESCSLTTKILRNSILKKGIKKSYSSSKDLCTFVGFRYNCQRCSSSLW